MHTAYEMASGQPTIELRPTGPNHVGKRTESLLLQHLAILYHDILPSKRRYTLAGIEKALLVTLNVRRVVRVGQHILQNLNTRHNKLDMSIEISCRRAKNITACRSQVCGRLVLQCVTLKVSLIVATRESIPECI